MSIKCSEISDFIESFAPVHLAESWDNVGLLMGSGSQEVKRVMVCLDVTSKVVDEAVEKKVDLLVSHHPFIFGAMKRINEDEFRGNIIYKLIRNNIGVYSAHTNLDVAEGGVNEQLAALLGLTEIKILKKYKLEINGKEYGMGNIGLLGNLQSLNEFVLTVKGKLNIGSLRVVGSFNGDIKKVAVFCGSFDEGLSRMIKDKADVLVTGDLKYHAAMDMAEMGLCVIDAGHFATERIIVSTLVEMLAKRFCELEVISNSVEKDPFIFS